MKVFGSHEARVIEQLARCMASEEGSLGVLCADAHLGYSQPIGGAIAYREHISPSGVGHDIGCGNKAVMTNLRMEELDRVVPQLMDEIFGRISFGMGRHNREPVDHPVLDRIREASFPPQRELLDLAADQLGTVGAGNHYVDLFRDERDRIWIGVHFGSRGFGHKTASGFLALAQGKAFGEKAGEGEMDSPPIVFPTDSELGQAYIEAMTLAGEYAYAGRDVVVKKVLEILQAEAIEEVHNHHNYAWREEHGARVCPNCAGHGTAFATPTEDPNVFMVAAGGHCRECGGRGRVGGEEFWVVRKGCTPAFPGQQGFVGATMGEESVILEGTETGVDALFSTVHGAGRTMSRTQAAGKQAKVAVCSVRDCDEWVYWKRYREEREARGLRQDERLSLCPQHPDGKMVRQRRRVKTGLIDFEEVQRDLKLRRIELRGGAADEAPGAYKRLGEVLAAQGDTIRVLHRLRPIGVAMASADTYDPFKD